MKFCDVRSHAKQRGIVCDLKFGQYLKLVQLASIRSSSIGKKRGQYQLGRLGDTGGYSAGNCRFITVEQNRLESVLNGGQELGNMNHSGEAHGHAKMTDKKVLQLRKLHCTGNYTQQALADRFGISLSTTNDIVRNKSWNHL